MRDSYEMGSAPYGEDCVPVSSTENYVPRMKKECRIYAEYLQRLFPKMQEKGIALSIKGNPHDFGTYYEVSASYDDSNEASIVYLFETVDANIPEEWDDIARQQLKDQGVY